MKAPTLIITFILTWIANPNSHAQSIEGTSSSPGVEVQTAKVIRTTLRRRITAYGIIAPEPAVKGHPAAIARLSPALAGIITEANGIEGQTVNKGDLLFQLDSRVAQAALTKSKMTVDFALKNAQRQRILIKAEGTSKKNLLLAEQALTEAQTDLATAKVNLSLLHAYAPISGVLTKFSARIGEAADPATVLAEIVDLNHLVAIIRVPRNDVAELKNGQQALLRISGKESPTEASVSFISPQINPLTNTISTRLTLAKKSPLRPGQFVAASIIIQEKPQCLAVPREAIHTDHKGNSTLSIVSNGTSKQISVKTGLRDGQLIEVEGEGINEGVTVITTGSYALPDQTKIHSSAK